MLTIFVDQITPRISYTLDFIFSQRNIEYRLITDWKLVDASTEHLIYTHKKTTGNWIPQAKIITETTISELSVAVGSFSEVECLSFDGVIDPIASVFYHLSRYEEYVSIRKDQHGRFPLSASSIPLPWIEKVMCDRWAEAVIQLIGLTVNSTSVNPSIVPTFDIDNAFAYKLKSGRRKLLSTIKDVTKLDGARLKERRAVNKGGEDPYDTYSEIGRIHKQFPTTRLFWSVGDNGKYDRNISIKNDKHCRLIRKMKARGITIGLHPSYNSFNDIKTIIIEKSKLEVVLSEKITSSRQHYLRFSLPKTYRALEKAGFTDEYSMGFAENVGFRCGTARPHYWFDIGENVVSNLVIHPFAYMDGTLREYMNLSIDESKVKISSLYNEVKRYGGDFVFLWHNETIGDYGAWNGWSSVLNHTLSLEDESK